MDVPNKVIVSKKCQNAGIQGLRLSLGLVLAFQSSSLGGAMKMERGIESQEEVRDTEDQKLTVPLI